MKEIIYPISIEYRKHWGYWEAIREIVQNALDSSKETTKIYKQNENLIIEDKGKGLQVKHLLFGISEKENKENARGQFGEGLKIALLVLTRLGCQVEIISGNLLVKPTVTEIEGEKCLKIQYDYLPYNYEGTKVIIYNYTGETFEDRFILNRNDKVLFSNLYWGDIIKKPENEKDGKLYVKDIYVTNLANSKFSYNLRNVRLEESRNIVDEWSLKCQIGYLWSECEKEDLWEELMLAFKEKRYELECYFISIYNNKVKEVIRKTFQKVFGPSAVLKTSDILANECMWRNREVINIFNPEKHEGLYKILPTDREFLENEQSKKDIEIMDDQLTETEKENLELARSLAKMISPKYDVKVYYMEDAEGKVKLGDTLIKLNLEIMNDKHKVISTLIHELTHLEYNVLDMTINQIHYLSDMGAELLEKYLDAFNTSEQFITTILESKIGKYTQKRISIPKEIVKKQNINKGDKVIVKLKKVK